MADADAKPQYEPGQPWRVAVVAGLVQQHERGARMRPDLRVVPEAARVVETTAGGSPAVPADRRAVRPARAPRRIPTIPPAGTVLRLSQAGTATTRGRPALSASSGSNAPRPGSHQGTGRRCLRPRTSLLLQEPGGQSVSLSFAPRIMAPFAALRVSCPAFSGQGIMADLRGAAQSRCHYRPMENTAFDPLLLCSCSTNCRLSLLWT